MASIVVRDRGPDDRAWAERLLAEHSGGTHVVVRLGELLDPLAHEGLVAELDGRPAALATIAESERGVEVLTLHAAIPGRGAGTRLLETALELAVASAAPRLWLVTTSDNLDAIRWYLRRGMTVAAVHADGVTRDRALKPEVPERNPDNDLPIRDYVELELPTDRGPSLPRRAFPRLDDVDRLPPEAAADALGPLFERAPRFLAALVARRPFGDDATLVARAHEVARDLPEAAQIELLDAHPRIGADPASVSALSHREQGYDAEATAAPTDADAERWVAEELDALNAAYERIFGFRFVVFVAGRPRREIVPLLGRAVRGEREAELRRGLEDVVHIAADRLRTLRAGSAASVSEEEA